MTEAERSMRKIIAECVSYRKYMKLTQIDIECRTGLSQQMISRIETLRATPELDTFLVYLKGVGLDLKVVPK